MYSRAAQPFQCECFTVTKELISRPGEVQTTKKKQINRQKQMVLSCFGEEKGKAGKRESGVDLGGGGSPLLYTLGTFSQHIPP